MGAEGGSSRRLGLGEAERHPLTPTLHLDQVPFHPLHPGLHRPGHLRHLLGRALEAADVGLQARDLGVLVAALLLPLLPPSFPLFEIVGVVAPIGLDLTVLQRQHRGDPLVE